MMIKKTSIDRKLVYDLFDNFDYDFGLPLLGQIFPYRTTIPTLGEIETILTKAENQELIKKGFWTDEQDNFLRILVFGTCLKTQTNLLDLSQIQWDQISRIFKFHHWKACRTRCLNDRPKKISWTAEEDQVLIELQALHPNKWCEIATQLTKICNTPYIRLGKQCRDRWVNKLDPKILNIPWYKEEELRLFQEVKRRGKRWADISAQVFRFKRTENTIKNRFYNLLKQEENRRRLGRVPKEERDLLLIDSVIETLTKELNNDKNENKMKLSCKQEETKLENNRFQLHQFDSSDISEIFVIKGRKMQKYDQIE